MCTKKGLMYFVGWLILIGNIILVLTCVILAVLPEATLEDLRRQYPYEYHDNILLDMDPTSRKWVLAHVIVFGIINTVGAIILIQGIHSRQADKIKIWMVLRIIELVFLIPTSVLMWMSQQYDHSSYSLSTFIGSLVFNFIVQLSIFFVACSLISEYEIIEQTQSGPYCSEFDSNDFTPV